MSLPPQVIRIKRKAADESPVSFLRLQENKRHRSDHFVYQRQEQDDHFGERPAGPQVPVIHTFSPRRKGGPGESSPAAKRASKPHEADQDVNPPTTPGNDNAEPRQYHVSRQDMLRANSQSLKQGRGGVSKKRQAPAVFVERKIKQVSAKKLERIRSRGDVRDPSPAPPPFVDTDMDGMDVDPKTPPKKYKKPGIAKFAEDNNEARGAKTEAPAAITDRWRNVDLGQLSAEMNAYTLEQIGLNIKQAEEEEQRRRNAAKKQTLASPLKYKPKAPVQRYAERHPDPAPVKPDKEMADKDDNMSDGSDDDDYIIETYVRVPASRIGDHVPPQTVGLLVFDGEPDIEYFYGDASDSEDEWAEDEEDENAENYYTADYPDDEVASDDEYGYNAYAYRTGNASDLEEYDANSDDDVHHSGGEDNEEGRFKKFKAEYDARKGL